jgi:trimeric autotransporter adhesin
VLGFGLPTGTFALTIPSLDITTAAIAANASADAVLSAIQAVAPAVYQKAFSVTQPQNTNFGFIWQIEFVGPLAQTDVPQVVLAISGLTAQQIPVPDTLTALIKIVNHGGFTGEDEMFTVSLEDGATSGTFTLAVSNLQIINSVQEQVTLATTAGIAFDAAAADVQSALNAVLGGSIANVTGSAGGPWTIEFVGDLGAQQLLLSATSALALAGLVPITPPGANTAGVDPPVVSSSVSLYGGSLGGTYRYNVTALNANGETTAPNVNVSIPGPTGSVTLSWSAVPTATSYKVYRGGNLLLAQTTQTSFTDAGGASTSQSPPGSNTTGLAAPTGLTLNNENFSNGALLTDSTFYYKVTAFDTTGESLPSSEVSISTAGNSWNVINVNWSAVTNAAGYRIYRGTSPNGENVLVATTTVPRYSDSGTESISQYPNGSGTDIPQALSSGVWGVVNDPFTNNCISGVLSPGTYYYAVSAIRDGVESGANGLGSTSPTLTTLGQYYSITWKEYLGGATAYNVYRSTGPIRNPSNTELIATIGKGTLSNGAGTQWTFFDFGGAGTSGSPPGTDQSLLSTPTQVSAGIVSAGGALSTATYYYKVTATNSLGETTGSNEESIAVTAGEIATVNWDAVPTATGYKIYRGTVTNTENTLIATIDSASATVFYDSGPVNTSHGPPLTNTALIGVPVQTAPNTATTGGAMAAGTYYYVVTAYTTSGETTASNEESIAVTGPTGEVTVNWNAVSGADGYKIYRGTSAGSENARVATTPGGSTTSFADTDVIATFSCTELVHGSPAINEVQTVTVKYAAGGRYALGFNGADTSFIAFDAAAATVLTQLQGLVTIGPDNCSVAGSNPALDVTVLTVIFTGALGGQPLPLITTSDTGLFGTVAYTVALTDVTTGNLTLTYGGQETPEIAVAGSSATVRADLVALSTIGNAGNVEVSGANGGPWTVVLAASIAGKSLTGSVLDAIATTTYQVTFSGTPDQTFLLNFGGQTTQPLPALTSAATLQTSLAAIMGAGNVVVLGENGGPWTVTITLPLGQLAGGVSGGNSPIYSVTLEKTIGGTFLLDYGTPGGTDVTSSTPIVYNSPAADVQAAIAPIATAFGGTFVVTGDDGGPWQVAVAVPNAQNFTLTGDGILLIGEPPISSNSGASAGPTGTGMVVLCYPTGPNFVDAPGNWSDGTIPAVYLPDPPNVEAVIPLSGGTLAAGTYYYAITALNANGETIAGVEASGTTGNQFIINFTQTPTGGTWSLDISGVSTAAIAYNANTAAVQAAVLAVVGLGNAEVSGTGTEADPWIVTFIGLLAKKTQTTAGANNLNLAGATVSVRVESNLTLSVWWNQVLNATGYNVYRSAFSSAVSFDETSVLVAVIGNPAETVFHDDGTEITDLLVATTAGTGLLNAAPPVDDIPWHTAVGDAVYLQSSNVSYLYNISKSYVNLISPDGTYFGWDHYPINAYTEDSSYTGRVGLPVWNPNGYEEYRPLALSIGTAPGLVLPISIGDGNSAGSQFTNLDTGTAIIAMTVNGMGGSTDTAPALLWVGVNAASEIDLFAGSLGIAIYPGQVAQLATVRQAYQENVASDTTLVIGEGVILSTLLKNGGDTLVSSDVTTINGKAGSITQDGGGATLLSLNNCVYVSRSRGEINQLNVSTGGVFDRSSDAKPLQIGQANLYAGATYLDPHGCTYNTIPGTMVLNQIECGDDDVIVKLGKNVLVQRTQL